VNSFECVYCAASLPEQAIYCATCSRQVRCKKCLGFLIRNGEGCIYCGARIGSGDQASGTTNGHTVPGRAINTFEYEETAKSRKFSGRFSDRAAALFTAPLSPLLATRLNQNQSRDGIGRVDPRGRQPLALQPPLLNPDNQPPNHSSVQPPNESESGKDRLAKVFEFVGEQISLIDPRLKATSKLDYGKRLTCLLLFAHQHEGRNRLSRATVVEVLRSASVYDSNILSWIRRTSDLVHDDSSIGLSVPGREFVRKILDELAGEGSNDGWMPTSQPQRRNRQTEGARNAGSPDASNKTRQAKSGSPHSPVHLVKGWVAGWKAHGLDLNVYASIENKPASDKGIVGLWAVRIATDDGTKKVSPYQLAKFLYEAFEIQVDGRALDRALASAAKSGKRVIRPDDHPVLYQVTPAGAEYAAELVGSASLGSSTEDAPTRAPDDEQGHEANP
jgi:hypothetical protein